ncbi:MAG: hypothetical protein QGH45_12455, partial [Myxococcota bacterium]|nr:hypothetical protein [Myxococcota bacterium]
VQHLCPRAQLLGDMDLHEIEQLFDGGIPLESALAGIRKGAKRLSRLKRPPRGLPLARMRKDIELADRHGAEDRDAARKPDPAPEEGGGPEADDSWRPVVRALAADPPEPAATALSELAGTEGLGQERAFVRFLAISREHYQRVLEALPAGAQVDLRDSVGAASAAILASMSADAREDLVAELVRRRLIEQDPVLDPRRFWQD